MNAFGTVEIEIVLLDKMWKIQERLNFCHFTPRGFDQSVPIDNMNLVSGKKFVPPLQVLGIESSLNSIIVLIDASVSVNDCLIKCPCLQSSF